MEMLKCFFGPELYMVFRQGSFVPYEANLFEKLGGKVESTMRTCARLSAYLSPIILITCYRRGFGSSQTALKYGVYVMLLYGAAVLVRGVGRVMSREYLTFLTILNETLNRPTEFTKRALRQYDFEFNDWPTDYEAQPPAKPLRFLDTKHDFGDSESGILISSIRKSISCVVVHTVGRFMVYPGTISLIQSILWPTLLEGRSKLIGGRGGTRYKLKSTAQDFIDCVFVDRRNDVRYPRGNILVITCEGNAGFYETGIVGTAVDAGFSVLGWNHPGFGGSSGTPWPENECAAADVVLQFATHRLGFGEPDVIVFAWSIGGFTASWLGMNYRDLRGLIMDATFDDVLPLAYHTMPPALAPIVEDVIKGYFDLNIGEQVKHFNGPVTFIRRLNEEILVTEFNDPDTQRRSNRINYLLRLFLRHRYPNLFNDENAQEMERYIALTAEQRVAENKFNENDCYNVSTNYFAKNRGGVQFPSDIGAALDRDVKQNLAYFLAHKNFIDFEATHCVPLTSNLFRVPYHPWDMVLD